jgi:hypothetical protein
VIGARGGSFREQTKNAGRHAVPVRGSDKRKNFLPASCSGAFALVAEDDLNVGIAAREVKGMGSFERSA